jgi:hypothetical protein
MVLMFLKAFYPVIVHSCFKERAIKGEVKDLTPLESDHHLLMDLAFIKICFEIGLSFLLKNPEFSFFSLSFSSPIFSLILHGAASHTKKLP